MTKIESKYIIKCDNPEGIIIAFSGTANVFGGMPRFEFVNFLTKHFPTYDRHFYADGAINRYHLGIKGISTNIDETVTHFKEIISFYKKVFFLGVSAGGHAAILYGSLLKADGVIAFIPPILQNPNDKRKLDKRYSNLKTIINDSTQYHIFCNLGITDTNDVHHASQCDGLKNISNIEIINKNSIHLPSMRDNGELLSYFKAFIN